MNPVARRVRYVALFAFVGGALYVGAAVWIGIPAVLDALGRLGGVALSIGLAASMASYLLRFARWRLILGRLGHTLPERASLRVYLSGFALTTTPGKLGETLRSALLHGFGVPVGASLAAFFVDRLSDVVGVLALAALTAPSASAAIGYATILGLVLGLAWFARYLAAHLAARRAVVERMHRLRLHGLASWVDHGTAGFVTLWSPARAAAYAMLGLAAYGVQAVTFGAFVQRLWPALDFAAAMHIFLVATLTGAASMVPGGLGAMELALVALLAAQGVPVAVGTPLAIAIRAVTLWFAILVGVICLGTFRVESNSARDGHRRPS